MPLHESNPTLYNAAVRMGLTRVMEFLKAKPEYETRLKLLYQFRAEGYSVLFMGRKILVNGVAFSPEDLDNPESTRDSVAHN